MGIGKTLADILQEKETNPNELSKISGVPAMTIYSIIKRDNSKVDIEILLKICKSLNVPVERFYREYQEEMQKPLTMAEQRMINQYRELTQKQKSIIDELIDVFRDQPIVSSDQPTIRYLFTAPDAASAGAGYTFFDSPDWDKCRFDVTGYDPDILDECFVVRVDGDSMQPMFFDGDYVLVRPDVPVEIGDIGLFVVNNDKGYIKKKGTDRLISVNPDYDDIYPSEDDVIEGKGKVLGTVEKV